METLEDFLRFELNRIFRSVPGNLSFPCFGEDVIFQLESVIVKLEILNSDKNEDVETGNWARQRWKEGERGGRREVSQEKESEREIARERERARESERQRVRKGRREREEEREEEEERPVLHGRLVTSHGAGPLFELCTP